MFFFSKTKSCSKSENMKDVHQFTLTEVIATSQPLPKTSTKWNKLTDSVLYYISKDMQPSHSILLMTRDFDIFFKHFSLNIYHCQGRPLPLNIFPKRTSQQCLGFECCELLGTQSDLETHSEFWGTQLSSCVMFTSV